MNKETTVTLLASSCLADEESSSYVVPGEPPWKPGACLTGSGCVVPYCYLVFSWSLVLSSFMILSSNITNSMASHLQ